MPKQKVKDAERRRCTRACKTCKHRKERCNASRPCGRCVQRGVGDQCEFTSSHAARQLSQSPVPSQQHGSDGLFEYAERGNPTPENLFSQSIDLVDGGAPGQELSPVDCDPFTPPVAQLSRLIHDGRGKFMFMGDAANLSFLQVIRRLVSRSIGACSFADDPLRHLIVEAAPAGQTNWVVEMVRDPPSAPDPADTKYLLCWYMRATNCILNLFDESEVSDSLSRWLKTAPTGRERDPTSAIFFLIFAVGAQTCPQDRDALAERYFNYGRFLTTVSGIMEDPSIATIRANILITMYLLGASRRNAAFMHLGIAVRAAYALGIHRSDVNSLFGSAEFTVRERIWKVLRVLDLFMSASLGRPPSTHETRDTRAEENYSASNDLCAIFEAILTQVYSTRIVAGEVLAGISQHHREWAQRYAAGLSVDDIQPNEFMDTDGGSKIPNIGLYHLKEAYYWTIMLLTRPFLIESVSRETSLTAEGPNFERKPDFTPPVHVLARACVDSAIRTVDLLRGLISADEIPKRLPFVVNSVFVAALVLGLAQFADLDQFFPVEEGMETAQGLLLVFSHHDPVAKRNLSILRGLQASCQLYLEKRTRRKMEYQGRLIGDLFGTVHKNTKPQSSVGAAEQISPQAFRDDADLSITDCINNGGLWRPYRPQPDAQIINPADENQDALTNATTTADLDLPMLESTLMFDIFDEGIPLFSTVNAISFSEEL